MEKHLNTMASPPPPPPPPPSSPTTFVQADTNSFRDLVQKLTGFSGHSDKLPVTHLSKPLISPAADHRTGPLRSPFKLQERRHTMRKLEIKLGLTGTFRNPPPSQTHRFDSPVPSPVTPLAAESLFFLRPGVASPMSPPVTAEDKAIADGGFYLHPSPMNTPRSSQPPELLNLFPSNSPSEQSQNALKLKK